MIVPLPGRIRLSQAMEVVPWTLTLVFLNLFFYFLLFAPPSGVPTDTGGFSSDFIESAGRYYLEWQDQPQYGRQAVELQALGAQSVRDGDFLKSLETWSSTSDPVGFRIWKTKLHDIFQEEARKPIHLFGLSQSQSSVFRWITYQFSHQGPIHLLSNVLFLIFFAACVEKMVGGAMMGLIYMMGGFVGGYAFLWMDHSGFIPMVGASASVTALMGFMVTATRKRLIPFFYFFVPIRHYMGRILLSPYWILPLFLVEDLTRILADPPGWGGGVAHSAHLGGAFAGMLLGLAHRWGQRRSELLGGGEPSS